MAFEITILGSGAALPTSNRNPSAQYINCNERHLLIDCGEATQIQIRKFGIKIQKIKHIFISHLHGDHFFGLVGLLSTMNLLGRDTGISIYAPKELEDIIQLQLKASGNQYEFKVNFVALQFDQQTKIFEDKLIEVWSFPLKHRIKTCGFLVKEKTKNFNIIGSAFEEAKLSLAAIPFFQKGQDYTDERGKRFAAADFTIPPKKPKSYAYCSDTAIVAKNAEIVSNADVLYHEATFTNTHEDRAKATLHSTAAQAGKFAADAKVKKLLLGHISSRYDETNTHLAEAQLYFQNTLVVADGMKIEV